MLDTTLKRTQDITLQAEREKREATEFIDILKTMSETEKAELRGYMTCLRTIRTIRTA